MSNRTANLDKAGPTALVGVAPEDFAPLSGGSDANERISRPALTYVQDALLRLRANKFAMASLMAIALVTLIGVVGPWLFPAAVNGVPFSNQQNPNAIDQGPTSGETLVVVDDFASPPADDFDPTPAPPAASAETLPAPLGLRVDGVATVNGVRLTWQPVAGAAGYQIFRLVMDSVNVSAGTELAGTDADRGIAVGDINTLGQHSFFDAMGLDGGDRYLYTVVPFIDDPQTGARLPGPAAATVATHLEKTIKISDALAIDPQTHVGAVLKDRAHWFGTDGLGRDVLARMIEGTRVDMLLALLVPTACILIGLIFGAASGLLGGTADLIFMRIVEIIDNFPDLLVFIILQVAIGKGLTSLFIAMTSFSWAGFARIVRGEVLRMRELEFVQASQLLGAPIMRLIGRHIGPNLLGLIIISWSARIPGVIAGEAFLSMLGLGLEQPTPSWGNVVIDAARRLQVNPMQFFLPAMVLGLTLLAFYVLGDALRDAFDPKLRGRN